MDTDPQHDPAELPLVTLDNSVLIALRDDDTDAPAVRQILDMNRAGLIVANVTAMTGLEAQREDHQQEWHEYIAWIESQGIARAQSSTHPRSIPFVTPGAPDVATYSGQWETANAEHLQRILFPNIPFMWRDYLTQGCKERGLTDTQHQAVLELDELLFGHQRMPPRPTPVADTLSTAEREELTSFLKRRNKKWMNAGCDREGLRIHISLALHTRHPERAVFVTSDDHFHGRTKLEALHALNFPGQILRPAEAVAFLKTISVMPSRAGPGYY
jgi:hypothetical protein